ncbi:hypothetical protein BJ508DRAFT_23220 [Ascobolus immersus RN42]|uniref:Uncharacterized protein n=1 Tax=Ascobolus immersus RN42 TaxID=1160509 RepID=A0A3N4HQK9_ASCIM|nr:hypothetical protein BJ508DRAFT_23220 [Ascobolus immersus RN42]
MNVIRQTSSSHPRTQRSTPLLCPDTARVSNYINTTARLAKFIGMESDYDIEAEPESPPITFQLDVENEESAGLNEIQVSFNIPGMELGYLFRNSLRLIMADEDCGRKLQKLQAILCSVLVYNSDDRVSTYQAARSDTCERPDDGLFLFAFPHFSGDDPNQHKTAEAFHHVVESACGSNLPGSQGLYIDLSRHFSEKSWFQGVVLVEGQDWALKGARAPVLREMNDVYEDKDVYHALFKAVPKPRIISWIHSRFFLRRLLTPALTQPPRTTTFNIGSTAACSSSLAVTKPDFRP